jgi:RNA polymerase subunit RPABC4/transcription elongation factor Spt4
MSERRYRCHPCKGIHGHRTRCQECGWRGHEDELGPLRGSPPRETCPACGSSALSLSPPAHRVS